MLTVLAEIIIKIVADKHLVLDKCKLKWFFSKARNRLCSGHKYVKISLQKSKKYKFPWAFQSLVQ